MQLQAQNRKRRYDGLTRCVEGGRKWLEGSTVYGKVRMVRQKFHKLRTRSRYREGWEEDVNLAWDTYQPMSHLS